MRDIVMVPGIGGSDGMHWQSRWQAADRRIRRFEPSSWERPELDDWVAALESEVERSDTPPLLVAHSLGCLLVTHWAAGTTRRVAGAVFVAPPDPAETVFPAEASGFAFPQRRALSFPSLVIASTNDVYGSIAHARALAAGWGSVFTEVGARGHLNGKSGLGDWAEGREMVAAFEATLA
ncbi:hypothetical protein ASE04_26660 [Rhizobium sp. Root708]|uniref:RBBP9/YdeN family alpha/beta hydrolase n=1 Tax=Rhizobium sp. Root708 TaxID=1736592 RepID=UPI0006F88F11|nr:alpha/beta fold hydrolase [Rhizobium sp. Root708]KRB59212.1 hypothetical protein ASE04_26660 [Rhizobium sp. Root708]